MLTLHHLNNSRSQRVLWLLEEIGVPYEIVRYQRQSNMLAPPELRAIHPLGKSPVITDNGNTIAESGAIIEYLVETYGGGRLIPPAGTPERLRFTYWLHYAEGSAMPLIVMKLICSALPKQVPVFLKPFAAMISSGLNRKLIDPQMADHAAFWNTELARDGWFAGQNFSAADIAMSFPVETGMQRMSYEGDRRAIDSFLQGIRARPAYQRAVVKGGAYIYARSA